MKRTILAGFGHDYGTTAGVVQDATQGLSRRGFMGAVAMASVYSMVAGKAGVDLIAGEVQLQAANSPGVVRLKLQDFPALANESGSVRLALNPLRGGPPSGPVPDGQFYPIIINRGPNNAFFAVNSRCTHQGCVVDAMDPSSNSMFCPCHGSVFGIDGRRIAGIASSALAKYTLKFDGQSGLEIQVPNLGYSVTASRAGAMVNGRSRIRLDFRVFRNVEYEVQFRSSVDGPAAPVMFSMTQEGPADQSVLTAATSTTTGIFVEPESTAGFYTVSARISEI